MNALRKEAFPPEENFYLGEESAFIQLNEFNEKMEKKRKNFMGYPCNAFFKTEKFFKWWAQSVLSQLPLNDVGNPYSESSYTLNARPFERAVMRYFANLFSLKFHWGYVTSGGTQGNEQGLYIGSQVLAKKGRPILYFSQEAHYSIASLGKVLGLDARVINALPSGEMDYQDLKLKLDATRPALFSLSIGTTFKGAIDRIEKIDEVVHVLGLKDVFYHADAALFGGYLPFYPGSLKPDLNFEKYPYDSIAVSGHKFFGSPIPLGIFLIRDLHIETLNGEFIEYIHSKNLTIPCSRSTLNTLIFWWIISTTSRAEFEHEAIQMIENAQYLTKKLKERQYPVWLNPYSNTVFFKAPSYALSKHWTLSLFTCPKLGPLAHAIMMQHIDKVMIDEFLKELDQEQISLSQSLTKDKSFSFVGLV